MDVPKTCNFIKTYSECEAAAQHLGLSDASATSSSNKGNHDPPYCYFEGGKLQFNSDGKNTGKCGAFKTCLCKSPTTTMTTTTTSTTTATTNTTTATSTNTTKSEKKINVPEG